MASYGDPDLFTALGRVWRQARHRHQRLTDLVDGIGGAFGYAWMAVRHLVPRRRPQ